MKYLATAFVILAGIVFTTDGVFRQSLSPQSKKAIGDFISNYGPDGYNEDGFSQSVDPRHMEQLYRASDGFSQEIGSTPELLHPFDGLPVKPKSSFSTLETAQGNPSMPQGIVSSPDRFSTFQAAQRDPSISEASSTLSFEPGVSQADFKTQKVEKRVHPIKQWFGGVKKRISNRFSRQNLKNSYEDPDTTLVPNYS